MSYPLRLPPELDAECRERCERLGISLNAFIAVALDAYLRGAGGRAAKGKRAAGSKPGPKAKAAPGGAAAAEDEPYPDWRFFHPNPDTWALVDPEFQKDEIWEQVDADSQQGIEAIEAKYWSTRQRPAGQ